MTNSNCMYEEKLGPYQDNVVNKTASFENHRKILEKINMAGSYLKTLVSELDNQNVDNDLKESFDSLSLTDNNKGGRTL